MLPIDFIVWKSREDYEAFLAIGPFDRHLPDTWDAWVQEHAEEVRKCFAKQRSIKEIAINPYQYTVWLSATHKVHSTNAVVEYAGRYGQADIKHPGLRSV